jgi:hypothetical protein
MINVTREKLRTTQIRQPDNLSLADERLSQAIKALIEQAKFHSRFLGGHTRHLELCESGALGY